MKIWITLPGSPGSLMAGGLERCDVWFSKPHYQFTVKDVSELEDGFLPWYETQGLGYWGWVNDGGNGLESRHVSFGKVFGYGDGNDRGCAELAEFVWAKVRAHLIEPDIRKWGDLTKKQYRHQDFLLEIDLTISLNAQ